MLALLRPRLSSASAPRHRGPRRPAESTSLQRLPLPKGAGSLGGTAAAAAAGRERPAALAGVGLRGRAGPFVKTQLPALLGKSLHNWGSRFPSCHRGLGSKWGRLKGRPYPGPARRQPALRSFGGPPRGLWRGTGCEGLPATAARSSCLPALPLPLCSGPGPAATPPSASGRPVLGLQAEGPWLRCARTGLTHPNSPAVINGAHDDEFRNFY